MSHEEHDNKVWGHQGSLLNFRKNSVPTTHEKRLLYKRFGANFFYASHFHILPNLVHLFIEVANAIGGIIELFYTKYLEYDLKFTISMGRIGQIRNSGKIPIALTYYMSLQPPYALRNCFDPGIPFLFSCSLQFSRTISSSVIYFYVM